MTVKFRGGFRALRLNVGKWSVGTEGRKCSGKQEGVGRL